MLSLQNVTCGYGSVPVLRDVTLSFPEGSITALLGCNGCGKSTLLRTAALGGGPPVLVCDTAALGGGLLVLVCDTAAHVLFSPFEVPVGILLSFLGGPFFILLLLRQKRGRLYA